MYVYLRLCVSSLFSLLLLIIMCARIRILLARVSKFSPSLVRVLRLIEQTNAHLFICVRAFVCVCAYVWWVRRGQKTSQTPICMYLCSVLFCSVLLCSAMLCYVIMYVCTYVRTCACMYVFMYVCTCICSVVKIFAYVNAYLFTYVSMYVCEYVYAWVCM